MQKFFAAVRIDIKANCSSFKKVNLPTDKDRILRFVNIGGWNASFGFLCGKTAWTMGLLAIQPMSSTDSHHYKVNTKCTSGKKTLIAEQKGEVKLKRKNQRPFSSALQL